MIRDSMVTVQACMLSKPELPHSLTLSALTHPLADPLTAEATNPKCYVDLHSNVFNNLLGALVLQISLYDQRT